MIDKKYRDEIDDIIEGFYQKEYDLLGFRKKTILLIDKVVSKINNHIGSVSGSLLREKAEEQADQYVKQQEAQGVKLSATDKANIRSDFLNGYFKALGQ